MGTPRGLPPRGRPVVSRRGLRSPPEFPVGDGGVRRSDTTGEGGRFHTWRGGGSRPGGALAFHGAAQVADPLDQRRLTDPHRDHALLWSCGPRPPWRGHRRCRSRRPCCRRVGTQRSSSMASPSKASRKRRWVRLLVRWVTSMPIQRRFSICAAWTVVPHPQFRARNQRLACWVKRCPAELLSARIGAPAVLPHAVHGKDPTMMGHASLHAHVRPVFRSGLGCVVTAAHIPAPDEQPS